MTAPVSTLLSSYINHPTTGRYVSSVIIDRVVTQTNTRSVKDFTVMWSRTQFFWDTVSRISRLLKIKALCSFEMSRVLLVNNQLDAQFFFRIYLFKFSTCFEHPCAHHQENQLYYYRIWYMSLCR